MEALLKEYRALRDRGTWNIQLVTGKRELMNLKRKPGNETLEIAGICSIAVEKGSEFPKGALTPPLHDGPCTPDRSTLDEDIEREVKRAKPEPSPSPTEATEEVKEEVTEEVKEDAHSSQPSGSQLSSSQRSAVSQYSVHTRPSEVAVEDPYHCDADEL